MPSKFIETSFFLQDKEVTLTLTKGSDTIYSTKSDSSTHILFTDLEPGFYKLNVANELRDSILVHGNEGITANIELQIDCPFKYFKDYIPACPVNSKDPILPILYRHEKKLGKTVRFYLVDYIAQGCLPRYYCKIHDYKF